MDNKSVFVKFAAICSLLGALTTVLLTFIPNPSASGEEATALLHSNTLYLFKTWVLFLHPQFNFIACMGITLILYKRFPLQIIVGTFFLFIWAYTEMMQQALVIDALNQIWRPGFLNEEQSKKEAYNIIFQVASGMSDSYYFLLLYGFGLGSFCFGLALVKLDILGKVIGYSLLLIGILSLAAFASYYLNASSIGNVTRWVYKCVYPYLQPSVRIAIAIWLLKKPFKCRMKETNLNWRKS